MRKKQIWLYYILNDTTLDCRNEIRDLGVELDTKLQYAFHIEKIVAKAFKMLGFVLRAGKHFKNRETLITLYFTYVSSNLECASQVWSPLYNIHIERIESVQRRFVRAMKRRDRLTLDDYGSALRHYKLPLLQRRREFLDQMFLFKILNNDIDCLSLRDRIGLRVPRLASRQDSVQFYVPQCRTNYLANSFLNRARRSFNINLSGVDVFNATVSEFRRSAKRRLIG